MTLKQALLGKARKFEALAELLDDADVRKEVEAWQASLTPQVEPLEAPTPLPPKALAQVVNPHKPVTRREKKRGLQAQVLRALFTGPAMIDELAKCCGFDRRTVMDIVGGMRSNGYAVYDASNMVQLTKLGQRVAEHMAHAPRALALPPGRVAQLKQQVNGEARL